MTGILENPTLWASSCSSLSSLWLLQYRLAKQRSEKSDSLSNISERNDPTHFCEPDLFAAFTFGCLFRLPCGASWIFEVDVTANFSSDLDCFGMMWRTGALKRCIFSSRSGLFRVKSSSKKYSEFVSKLQAVSLKEILNSTSVKEKIWINLAQGDKFKHFRINSSSTGRLRRMRQWSSSIVCFSGKRKP